MAEILVTGATGTVGSVVAECLVSLKVNFRVFVRNPEKLFPIIKNNAEVFTGEYENESAVKEALEGVERLFLLTPIHPNMDANEKQLIDLAKASGVQYLVKMSAIGADLTSKAKLARMHAASEKHLEASGMEYAILRGHSFMQNLLGSIASIQTESKIFSALGDGEIPMVDARDIGEAAGMILKDNSRVNEVLELTGPKSISYDEIASSLSRQLDKEITYVSIPEETAKVAMVDRGFPDWLADDLMTLTDDWRNGKNNSPSDSIKEILGRSPRTVGEFISDHYDLFKGG